MIPVVDIYHQLKKNRLDALDESLQLCNAHMHSHYTEGDSYIVSGMRDFFSHW